jgi:hypothetical protein
MPGGEEPADRALADELLRELEEAAAAFTTLERQAFAHALVAWSSGETARRLGMARKSADNCPPARPAQGRGVVCTTSGLSPDAERATEELGPSEPHRRS